MTAETREEREGAFRVDVEVIRDVERLQAVRAELEALPFTRFDADLDVYLAHLDTGAGARPYVALVRSGVRPVGAILARHGPSVLETKVGYRTRLRSQLTAITAVSGGIVAGDATVAAALAGAIDGALRAGEADACVVPSVAPDAHFTQAIRALPGWRRSGFEPTLPRLVADVPESFDAYLRARPAKARETIRRTRRKLPAALPNAVVRRFERLEELDELVELLEQLVGTTWQRGLGVGFVAAPAEVATYRIAMAGGRFRCWVLLDGSRPIAYALGWIYGGRYFGRFTGFDPEYAELAPGSFVVTSGIADLCGEPDLALFDFGAGESVFKRKLADRSELETDLVVFGTRPRLLVANALRSGGNGLAALARRGLADVPALNRLGRKWRGRAARIGGG
jgi:hypothetical protein